jgi:hypothetical protein
MRKKNTENTDMLLPRHLYEGLPPEDYYCFSHGYLNSLDINYLIVSQVRYSLFDISPERRDGHGVI